MDEWLSRRAAVSPSSVLQGWRDGVHDGDDHDDGVHDDDVTMKTGRQDCVDDHVYAQHDDLTSEYLQWQPTTSSDLEQGEPGGCCGGGRVS